MGPHGSERKEEAVSRAAVGLPGGLLFRARVEKEMGYGLFNFFLTKQNLSFSKQQNLNNF